MNWGWFLKGASKEAAMEYEELKNIVYTTAVELAGRGPGWAQESVVLREVQNRLRSQGSTIPALQQIILTAWHDLFLEKKLSWGYDLDNPNSPFFHVPERAIQP